jgi:hypothetical protein
VRRNQELKKGLRLRLREAEGHRNWDRYIPDILFTTRRRRNDATGQSPSELLLGRDLARPGEARTRRSAPAATERVEAARKRQARYAPRYDHPTVGQLRVGDWVFARNHPISNVAENFNAGLAPKWKGPFKVMLVHGADDIRLHVSELKRAPSTLRDDAIIAAADPDSTPNAAQPTHDVTAAGPENEPSSAPENDPPVNDDGGELVDASIRENPGPDPGGGPRKRGRPRKVAGPPVKITTRNPGGESPKPYNLRSRDQPTGNDSQIPGSA